MELFVIPNQGRKVINPTERENMHNFSDISVSANQAKFQPWSMQSETGSAMFPNVILCKSKAGYCNDSDVVDPNTNDEGVK